MTNSEQNLWAAGHDEIVEVNQRALIDKVLARYSGEFTVFRELLQNSDDAGSRSVEIRFETDMHMSREKGVNFKHEQGLPDLKTAVVHRWTFKNNGMLFRDQDWNRLKKIAEGNPDEEKIGAFGVGFYSLFSVTDEPWVTSGGQWMNFYWKDKKDQLYVRRGTVPASADDVANPWTTFQMTLREPGPIPAALDFARFLASSITFMTHLSEVSVYFDDKRLVRLSKNRGMSKEMSMLSGLKCMSPEGMMNVKTIETMPLHIEAEVVRWVYNVGSEKEKLSATTRVDTLETATHQTNGFFSPQSDGSETLTPEVTLSTVPKESTNLLEAHSSNIVLTIFTANVDVRVDKKMTEELLRSTKKNPPSRLRYELIYTEKDEYDSSVKAEEEAAHATGSVFQGLRADLEGTGSTRVFIGHSTGQTTGIGGHMATRFIPTVERESIDLVDRNVAVWNKELLYVGGFLARSAYELEMDAIKGLWEGAAVASGSGGRPDEDVQTRLRGRALHALKFFTFHPSTPSPVVSNLMQTAFFACAATHPFSIISSDGVRNAMQVHSPNPEFSGFLKHLPLISEDVFNGAKTMIAALRSRGMIENVSFADILNGLRLGPLNETETVACLNWWIGVTKRGNSLNLQWRAQLLDSLVISITGPYEKMMKLSDAQTFLNSKTGESIIPTDGPLPSTLLPMSITSSFDPEVLASVFPWKQLSMADWLRHLTDPEVAAANAEFDITNSASWAERVLSVLAQAWPSLPETAQDDVIKVLNPKSCIPTSTGLKVPDQAYFPSVKLFRDLPIVTMPSGDTVEGNLEKVLQSLGVRKHVELQIIFERMIETGDWTTYDLVKYLVSIQSTLTPDEMERMRQSSAFLAESVGEKRSAGASKKVQVMDLYEPVDINRELGLPVIDWGADNQWRPESDEAKFVYSLGLRRAPLLSEILNLAASDDPTVRTKAFTFFLDNSSDKYHDYDPEIFRDLAFVPAVRGSVKLLSKPFQLYAGSEWAALGFAVVDPALHDGAAGKLKLKNHPPTSELMNLLGKSPPEDEATARKWFEALSSRVPDFSQTELRKLSKTPFVPVTSTEDNSTKRLQPSQCYSGTGGSELHCKLFAFVDFGARANVFLAACGTKQEPSVEDIALLLVAEPQRIYKLANGRENYLLELRNIAVNWERLSTETILVMKRSNIVLGSRRVKKSADKASSEGDEDDWDLQDELLQAKQVVIVDDTSAYQLFGDRIFCAPQENMLEELYYYLGSPRLSSLIKEDYRTSGEVPYSKIGAQTRRLILERLPLFLRDHPQSRTKVTLNWLNEGNNFTVKVFGKLLVTKSLQYGNTRDSKSLEASAIAKRDGNGPIELWLDGYQQVNMHEISTSLCRIIFESPKANDALSFMTILSADLKVLKQWGYNVDKIIRQQKAEREAAERARSETETSLILKPPRISMGDAQARTRPMHTRVPSPPNGTATTAAPQRNAEQEAAYKARPGARASLVSNPPERTAQDNRTRTSTTQTFILTSSIGIARPAPPQQNAEGVAARAETRASPASESPQMTTGIPTRQPNIPSHQTNTATAALRRQMAERGAAGHARTETIDSPISNVPEMTGQDTRTTIPTRQPMIPPPPTGPTTAAPRPPATPRSTGHKRTSKRSRLSSAIHKLKRLLGRNRSDTSPRQAFPPESEDELSPSDPVPPRRDEPPLPPLPNANLPEGAPWLSKPGLPRTSRRAPPSGPTTAPQSNLANNIDMAIKACSHERNNRLRNREAMQVVEESQDDGYCDITGRIRDSDLNFVGQVGDIKVFAAPDLPEGRSLIQRKHDVLSRFSQVLKYLAEVFKIPLTSMHIFADKEKQLIAFNRNGSLFVNLGYFEAWHDRDVQRGDFGKALISWYFTLAHEIAHNLVHQHNSEHEFYFSAICEAYLVPLAKLLPDS